VQSLPSFQLVWGRFGRGQNPPPQFGQTSARTVVAHSRQNVHSNEQIIASVDSGGSSTAQFSQTGRSSNMQ
jgi:hypothetical protein